MEDRRVVWTGLIVVQRANGIPVAGIPIVPSAGFNAKLLRKVVASLELRC
jgi:hypothetical protein